MMTRNQLERLGYLFFPRPMKFYGVLGSSVWDVEYTPFFDLDVQRDSLLVGNEEMLVMSRHYVAYNVTLQEAIEAAHVHYVKMRVEAK